ncbi:MAG: hypothetical protein JNM17_25320 [Archangium sp.]|nr:hypothetical protein [Archangium sp.]
MRVVCDGAGAEKMGKPGGWAFIVLGDDDTVLAEGRGGEKKTTSLVMELTAAAEGLEAAARLERSNSPANVAAGGDSPRNERSNSPANVAAGGDSPRNTVERSNGPANVAAGGDSPRNTVLVSDCKIALDVATGAHLPKPQKYHALCKRLRDAFLAVNATARWVKAHSGEKWNEEVDARAASAREETSTRRKRAAR